MAEIAQKSISAADLSRTDPTGRANSRFSKGHFITTRGVRSEEHLS